MATHDYIISNASGAAVRADLNNALAAIASNNSSATEPTTTYAYQWWADTGSSPTVMKLRNAANSAWITLFQLDGEWSLIPFENGTAAAPSIYFKDSGTDTGLFSGGTDQVNISTGGTERVEWGTSEVVFNDGGENYDFRIESDTNAQIFFVDASANAVGIGTTSPAGALDVGAVSGAVTAGDLLVTTGSTTAKVTIGRLSSTSNDSTSFRIRDRIDRDVLTVDAGNFVYSQSGSERARIDSSGRLLVGTSSARSGFQISTGFGNVTPVHQFEFNSQTYNGLSITHNAGANTYPAVLAFGKSRGSSAGSYTAVANGDNLGWLDFYGADGTNMVRAATIFAEVDGTPGTNDMPGRLVFSTTANGASSPTERMRISQNGFTRISDNGSYVGSSTAGYHEVTSSNPGTRALLVTNQGTISGGSENGLHVLFRYSSPDNNVQTFIACEDSAATRMRVYADGDVWTSDAGILTSDATLKRDITDVTPKLNDVMNLRVRNFHWEESYHPNKQDKKLIGFIAQEMEEVFPGLVSEHKISGGKPILDENGNETGETTPEVFKKGIKEAKLLPILVKALQEAVERIETLEATVAALEGA